MHEGKEHIGERGHRHGRGDECPVVHPLHQHSQGRAHHEGREREGRHDDADRPGSEADARAVERHEKAVDVPSHVEQAARDERVPQGGHAQEVEHAGVALARHALGTRQRALAPREHDQRDDGKGGEREHRAGMPETLDRVTGDQRPDGVGNGKAEREP